MADHLYVCHFSNGHIKVGRSIEPKGRIAAHADRVSCMGVELVEHFIAECTGHSAQREQQLISKCAEAAGTRFKSEWFTGLDYVSACEWASECANCEIDVLPDGVQCAQPRKAIPPERRARIEAAIKAAGSKNKLAAMLNERGLQISSYKVIDQWLLNGVPARYCPDIEDLTDVPCEDLCPEVKWHLVRSQMRATPTDNRAEAA